MTTPHARLPGLLVLFAAVACAPIVPDYRVSPKVIAEPPHPMPRKAGVVVAGFPVGLKIVDFEVQDPNPEWSTKAADNLHEALEHAAEGHPFVDHVYLAEPPPEAWRRKCEELVLSVLKSQWMAPADWKPEQGPPTISASLGPDLRDWGYQQGVPALLVGWGESVLPQQLSGTVDQLGSDSGDGYTVGVLQYVVLLVELSTGDVLWMAEKGETIGGEMADTYPDARNAWVAERNVGTLLLNFPGLPAHPGLPVVPHDEPPPDDGSPGT